MVCMECYFNVDIKLCFSLEICRLLLWWIPSFGYSLRTAIIGYCLYGKAHKLYSSEHLDIA